MAQDKTKIYNFKAEKFFNTYLSSWLEDFWKLQDDSTVVQYELFDYKSFVIKSRYHEQSFEVIKVNEGMSQRKEWLELMGKKELPEAIRHADFYLFNHSDNQYLLACDNLGVSDIITHMKQYNENWANNMMKAWQGFIFDYGSEASKMGDNILMNQKSMLTYLQKNNIVQKTTEVTFDINDEASIDEWFENQEFSEDGFRAFNDLDYTPFLMNGAYVIHDSSSASYFVYYPTHDLDANNGTWYRISSDEVHQKYWKLWGEDKGEVMSEAWSYTKDWDARAVEMAPHPWNMVARYEDGKLVEAGEDLHVLNLLQSYICAQLESEDLLSHEPDEGVSIDLDYMIRCQRYNHYNDITQVEAFFEYIKDLRFHDSEEYPASHMFNMGFIYQNPQKLEQWESTHPDKLAADVLKMDAKNQGYMDNRFSRIELKYVEFKKMNQQEKAQLLVYGQKHLQPYAELDVLPHAKLLMDKLVSALSVDAQNSHTKKPKV